MLQRLGHRLSRDLAHLIAEVAGVAVVGTGAYIAHPAAGLIVWGAGILGLSVASELSR